MSLALNVGSGRKIYIGRHLEVTVERVLELGAEVKVSREMCRGAGRAFATKSMNFTDRWEIDGGVSITLGWPRDLNRSTLLVEAPRWMVVSRDDFTLESHLELQSQADRKRGAA